MALFVRGGGWKRADPHVCGRGPYCQPLQTSTQAALPELRDAMSLAWRILLVWLAVLALFVVAGWVS